MYISGRLCLRLSSGKDPTTVSSRDVMPRVMSGERCLELSSQSSKSPQFFPPPGCWGSFCQSSHKVLRSAKAFILKHWSFFPWKRLLFLWHQHSNFNHSSSCFLSVTGYLHLPVLGALPSHRTIRGGYALPRELALQWTTFSLFTCCYFHFFIINRVFSTHQYFRYFIHPMPEDRDEAEDLPRGQLRICCRERLVYAQLSCRPRNWVMRAEFGAPGIM